ncbi:hypothetical protein SAMD00019534_092240 [Acytostelium subglobosum LB1]|uniref:hypothetical protein n=1 Tax=Acytostelium subglobosum LB1 TaxID=1410327 RepID=UPI000644EF47|nr:hypothetical protein SAMD00019534_092240 [Acytostelium subglobosum LB1]GAM26049.1 hypothetical protein SAMD00019534_092240 [Acytostelium subglobosum LB1]|eukprot:XP_012751092.1 hypothetical protein SAMD00019534_092240 [Acytostelium subglobosum LB1]
MMIKQLTVLSSLVLLLAALATAEQMYHRVRSPYPYYSIRNKGIRSNPDDPSPPPYDEYYYMQTLDHFNFHNQGEFAQRYLVSTTYWNPPQPGASVCTSPVLFYTGNEGDITLFYENSQFVTNVLAQQFGALLIFAEHRYYGATMPFGDNSSTPENLGYLTSEQALADYAQLLQAVMADMDISHCPVLAVGGSYGGMLASWFRMKYPNVVDGALAASAPILYFLGTGASSEGFNEIATVDFAQTSSEVDQLVNWLEAAITYMAMADYPYPANFLEPMPGNPINVSCSLLAQQTNDIQGLVQVMNVYFNSTGQAGQCNNVSVYTTSALGSNLWDYQACTEMVMPISANGIQDMFPAAPWSLSQLNEYCQQTWDVTPNANWITTYYQGSDMVAASNIIFSNGVLDPWRAGGVTTESPNNIIPIVIEGGAHHLDLRMPNAADPESVTNARALETKYLAQFAAEGSLRKARK